jgi:hypothetical protein
LSNLFVIVAEGVGVGMVLENEQTAQAKLTAGLFYLLKVGDDVWCQPTQLRYR